MPLVLVGPVEGITILSAGPESVNDDFMCLDLRRYLVTVV